jgi:poly(beta-D-mannuronate) lyase
VSVNICPVVFFNINFYILKHYSLMTIWMNLIKFIIKPGFLLIILQLFCKPVFPAEYYVINANEIRTAMTQAQPGDTITMANSIWVDEDIDFDGNGTENNPIILRAETPGNVILTGKSRMDISGSYLIVDGLYFLGGYLTEYKVHVIDIDNSSHHCRLTNIVIINYNPEDWGLFYKWVKSDGTYNRIDHCFFSGKNHQDALLKIVIPDNGPSYSRVDHNYFGELPVGKSGNGWETIRIQGPEVAAGETIVEDNFFYHCDGEGEIISLKAGDNDLRRNTFFECMGSLTCRKNVATRIYNNFFIGNGKYGTGGIRMYSKDHVITNNYFENLNGDSEWRGALSYMTAQVGIPEVENILAAFNTIVNCKYSIEVGVGRSASSGRIIPPRDLKFANNIALNSIGELIHYREDVTGITYEGNIMYGADIGIPFTTGIDTVDPKLILTEDGLWRPESDSPAIDAAVGDYSEVTIDMDGQPRNDGNQDVGADELSNEPILNRPLTRDDVGPDWIKRPDLSVAIFITKTDGGSGTVMLDPPNGIYSKGTVVTLTAIPDTGNQFNGWGGDLSGSENPTALLMDAHKSVTVIFCPPMTDNLSTWKMGLGEVIFDPPGGSYLSGTIVKITAIPENGWEFSHWGGALKGSANPESITMNGNTVITATFIQTVGVESTVNIPEDYYLYQNYPNPFNPTTTISFSLKEPGLTSLKVIDVIGHHVVELVNEYLPRGSHVVEFDASDLASSVYICEIRSGKYSSKIKMLLMR